MSRVIEGTERQDAKQACARHNDTTRTCAACLSPCAVARAHTQECNAQLDVVEKGLNQFLETKKMTFPR
jgi:hypothetical protein